MPEISIIVPVYKVEKYLEKCVNSILEQTFTNFELILVDDGSPDGSGQICDAYATIDKRVRVIHQKNGGLSAARNAGLEKATGRYVGFIDSDDYIHPQMYEKLYEALQKNKADLSICNYAYVDNYGNIDSEKQKKDHIITEVLNRERAFEKIDPLVEGYSFYVTAWNKLYKRDLFKNIKFLEGHVHEDEYIVHHIFSLCSKIAIIEDILYMYVQRDGSIMSSVGTQKSLDAGYAMLNRYFFFKGNKKPVLAKHTLRSAIWVICDFLSQTHDRESSTAINALVKEILRNAFLERDVRLLRLVKAWIGYLFQIQKIDR